MSSYQTIGEKSFVESLRTCSAMAKSRLLQALDAHKGRDYKIEKQKKQQKQAARTKKSRPSSVTAQNVQAHSISTTSLQQAENKQLESDESEAAETTVVCRESRKPPVANIV